MRPKRTDPHFDRWLLMCLLALPPEPVTEDDIDMARMIADEWYEMQVKQQQGDTA